MARRPRDALRLLAAAAALLLLAATARAEGGQYGRALLADTASLCDSTVPGGAANASSFTLAFDAASGCFTVGAGAACDTANGHCCVGTAAPTPPKFRFLLIKPSNSTPCAKQTELDKIKLNVRDRLRRLKLDGSDLKARISRLPSEGGTTCLNFSKASAACNDAFKLCGDGGCGALLVTNKYATEQGGDRKTCCAGLDRCAGVTCFLSGECVAEAGTCDPATGLCGPGTPTEDGTECSLEGGVQGSCQSGVCTAIDLCAGVTCEQQECEAERGTCDSATGECGPGPPTEDDTPCSAGSCQAGVCTDLCAGVTCEQGECETAPGTCDPATGLCGAGPPVANGTGCSAGSCQGGVCTDLCVGVTCQAGECESAPGPCDPATGECSPGPPVTDGFGCNSVEDGVCKDGVCTDLCAGVICGQAECTTAPGTCDPSIGECGAGPTADNGTPCTSIPGGTCQGGVCTDPCFGVTCGQQECEAEPGVCDSWTGECSPGPPAANGTACSSIAGGTCQGGVCTDLCQGVTCERRECVSPGSCEPATGECLPGGFLTGAPCSGGICLDGSCKDLCQGTVFCLQKECEGEPGRCDPFTGSCNPGPPAEDGTPCSSVAGGICWGGVCTSGDR